MSFQLIKNVPDRLLCKLECSRDNAQITDLTTGTYCVDKIIHTNFTSYSPSSSLVQQISNSVIGNTTNGAIEFSLDPTAPLGCMLYILHDGGTDPINVTGLLESGTYFVFNGQFMCFLKSINGWTIGSLNVD